MGMAGFDGEREAAKRKDGHNTWLDARKGCVSRNGTAGRSRRAIQHVNGVGHGVGPKRGGCTTGDQLTNVRQTSGGMHAVAGQQLRKLLREELPCVVTVNGTNHLRWRLAIGVEEGGEASDKALYMCRRLVLVLHDVYSLEPRVIVDEDEGVAPTAVN
eukprot:3403594-Pleurochrysis_carterae.AAC.3